MIILKKKKSELSHTLVTYLTCCPEDGPLTEVHLNHIYFSQTVIKMKEPIKIWFSAIQLLTRTRRNLEK